MLLCTLHQKENRLSVMVLLVEIAMLKPDILRPK